MRKCSQIISKDLGIPVLYGISLIIFRSPHRTRECWIMLGVGHVEWFGYGSKKTATSSLKQTVQQDLVQHILKWCRADYLSLEMANSKNFKIFVQEMIAFGAVHGNKNVS